MIRIFTYIAAMLLAGSFITAHAAPTITTVSSSSVSARTARVKIYVSIPAGETATYWVEYGTTTSYGKKSFVYSDPGPDSFNLEFSIDNLIPNTQHHWRAVGKGPTGPLVYGGDAVFTTTAAVAVAIDPNLAGNVLVPAGEDLSLRVTVTSGTEPLTYKWRRNGVLLKKAQVAFEARISFLKPTQATSPLIM